MAVAVEVGVSDGDGEAVCDGDAVRVTVEEGVPVGDRVTVDVAVWVGESERVDVVVSDRVTLRERVCVTLRVRVRVDERVRVKVREWVIEREWVCDGVRVTVGVTLAVTVDVGEITFTTVDHVSDSGTPSPKVPLSEKRKSRRNCCGAIPNART